MKVITRKPAFGSLGRPGGEKNQTPKPGALVSFADHFLTSSAMKMTVSPSDCIVCLNVHPLYKAASVITSSGEFRSRSNRRSSPFAELSSCKLQSSPSES